MESAATCTRKALLITLLLALTILTVTLPAHANFYFGSDWGGRDLTLLNGDTLSGTFSNVGQLYIPAGATISGSTDNLVVNAGRILIDGSLTGLPTPGYNLNLSSLTDIILNGSINSWNNIGLTANQAIVLSGTSTISLLEGGNLTAIVPPSISITTPIPAAAWLFGSALLGLAGIRRKRT
jgi:hypothetical protein